MPHPLHRLRDRDAMYQIAPVPPGHIHHVFVQVVVDPTAAPSAKDRFSNPVEGELEFGLIDLDLTGLPIAGDPENKVAVSDLVERTYLHALPPEVQPSLYHKKAALSSPTALRDCVRGPVSLPDRGSLLSCPSPRMGWGLP